MYKPRQPFPRDSSARRQDLLYSLDGLPPANVNLNQSIEVSAGETLPAGPQGQAGVGAGQAGGQAGVNGGGVTGAGGFDAGSQPLLLRSLREQKDKVEKKCLLLKSYLRDLDSGNEDFREFSLMFPTLLADIFGLAPSFSGGSSPERAWVCAILPKSGKDGERMKKALMEILSPQGLLCQISMRHQDDPHLSYHLPVARLPWATRQRIEAGEVPAVFQSKLMGSAPNGPAVIHFNILEYFLFCLVFCPAFLASLEDPKLDGLKSSGNRSSGNLQGLSNGSSSEGRIYITLLRQYCEAFVPSKRYTDLFLGNIAEFWLGQNPDEGSAWARAAPREFVAPSTLLISCVTEVVAFLIEGLTKSISPPSRAPVAEDSGLVALQKPLLSFLRSGLRHWNLRIGSSAPFTLLLGLWLRYIAPWANQPQEAMRQPLRWKSYVESNFPFYTSLLCLFLDQAVRLNYTSKDDCSQLVKVLEVFQAPELQSILADCEAAATKSQPEILTCLRDSLSSMEMYEISSCISHTIPQDQIDAWYALTGADLELEPLFFPCEWIDKPPFFFNPPRNAHKAMNDIAEIINSELFKMRMKRDAARHASAWDRLWSLTDPADRPKKDSVSESTLLKLLGDDHLKSSASDAANKPRQPGLINQTLKFSLRIPSMGDKALDNNVRRTCMKSAQRAIRFEGPIELLPPRSDEFVFLVRATLALSKKLKERFEIDVNLRPLAS
ncbi:MAG: hypothetical protein Q8P67_03755, partial [archaeon]|nr:hypothetical protein [archaeon]